MELAGAIRILTSYQINMEALVQLMEFPLSALSAVTFLLTAVAIHHYAKGLTVIKVLGSLHTARVLLGIGAILLAAEGTWSIAIHQTVWFCLFVLCLLLCLTFTLLEGLKRKANIGFMLNHLGILLILWASLFGAPDVMRARMIVGREVPVQVVYSSNGKYEPLPFDVQLEEFRIDYYADSISPRQFTSRLRLGRETMETSVNHPCSYQGYTFFQDSYDPEAERYTVLLVVKDPWLPVVYIGMMLLALGSVMLLFGKWKVKLVLPVTFVLTISFTLLSVTKINFGTLMPALRSWWFVPHLFIYMVAYSLMAFALVVWIISVCKHEDKWTRVADNLVRSSSALLIIGMLCGSVWARQAWGDYWAWDPKENWAAVTWLLSLMHLHLQHKRGWKPLTLLLLAFLALQITWYGVNYLPSAIGSLHTY